jgi:hypothetical protein
LLMCAKGGFVGKGREGMEGKGAGAWETVLVKPRTQKLLKTSTRRESVHAKRLAHEDISIIFTMIHYAMLTSGSLTP